MSKSKPKKNVTTSKIQRVRAKPISATPTKKSTTPKSITPTVVKKPVPSVRIQTAEGWKRSQMQELKMSKAKSKS